MTTAVMMMMSMSVTMTRMVSASSALRYSVLTGDIGGLFMAVSRVSLEASRSGRHSNQAVLAGGCRGRIILILIFNPLMAVILLVVVVVPIAVFEAVE